MRELRVLHSKRTGEAERALSAPVASHVLGGCPDWLAPADAGMLPRADLAAAWPKMRIAAITGDGENVRHFGPAEKERKGGP